MNEGFWLFVIIQIFLIYLKLTGIVMWGWLFVLIPLLLLVGFILIPIIVLEIMIAGRKNGSR